jgi:hypothetical protein
MKHIFPVKYALKSYDLWNLIGIRFLDGVKILVLYIASSPALEPAQLSGV